MNKRIWSLALVLSMLLLLASQAFAANQAELTLSVPDTLPAVGQTFTVSVDISGNPGFNALELVVGFNSAVVKCVNVKSGSASEGMLAVSNKAFTADSAKIAAASAENRTKNGSLASFTFEVVANGDANVRISNALLSGETGKTISYKVSGTTQTAQQTAQSDAKQTDSAAAQMIPAGHFRDVAPTYWAYAQIERAASLSLVAGFEDGTFGPEQSVTRAQFVLMLWRMEGKPQPKTNASFADAKAVWYKDALSWASENGYVTGTGNGKFNPDGKITRQEAMSILFRLNGSQSGMETLFTAKYDSLFADSSELAAWAKPAVYWAVYKELLTGVGGNKIAPKNPATRAQIAVILLRYMDNITTKEENR